MSTKIGFSKNKIYNSPSTLHMSGAVKWTASSRPVKNAVFISLATILFCHFRNLYDLKLMEMYATDSSFSPEMIKRSVKNCLRRNLLLLDMNASSFDSPNHQSIHSTEESQFSKQLLTNYDEIMMSWSEINLVLRYLNNVTTYLEWGSGGSTMNFARFAKQKAVSIEHNRKWCERMQSKLDEKQDMSHVDYRCVPVRRGTKGWGIFSGFEEGSYVPFRKYVDEIDKAGIEFYDMILIDGRARLASAMKALSYIKKNTIVVLHDSERIFDARRKRFGYREILKYYEIVESVGIEGKQGLAIMRRKSELGYLEGDHSEVQKLLDKRYQ